MRAEGESEAAMRAEGESEASTMPRFPAPPGAFVIVLVIIIVIVPALQCSVFSSLS